MTRIKFLEAVVGNRGQDDEYRFAAGQVVDFDEKKEPRRAQHWLRRGKAVDSNEDPGLLDPDEVELQTLAALEELSFADLKAYAAPFGITDRSKDALLDELAADGRIAEEE